MSIMQKAFIFIHTEPAEPWNIANSAMKVEGVKMAHAVTGAFDVIIYVELADMSALGALIEIIHSIKGVKQTQTAIVIPSRVERISS